MDKLSSEIKPGGPHSLWIDTTPKTNYPAFSGDLETEVLIIGAGIVGINCAYLLQKAGFKVAIIDAKKIVSDTTGHTTAKITALHGFIYHNLDKYYGKRARAYARANQSAIEEISKTIEKLDIDCDFKITTAYSYTEMDENVPLVEQEFKATKKLGLNTFIAEETELSFAIKQAVALNGQAQFHPRKYLLALAKEISNNRGLIFENTRATNIKQQGNNYIVFANNGKIKCKQIILATHFPFFDKGFFYARLFPYRSYALGLKIKDEIPEGIYYTLDAEHRSIRNQPSPRGPILIVGGGYHHSGQVTDTISEYKKVEKYASERFALESIDYYWSAEDYHSIDLVPFIGRSPRFDNIYVACGFGAWGMSSGIMSARIITDLIQQKENPWANFFNPSRKNLGIDGSKMFKQNTNVMSYYFKDIAAKFAKKIEEIPINNGTVVRKEGKRTAVFRDTENKVHKVSAICPHMACTVHWNNAEQTWDCPCHGSRFDTDGKMIHGPAVDNLRKL